MIDPNDFLSSYLEILTIIEIIPFWRFELKNKVGKDIKFVEASCTKLEKNLSALKKCLQEYCEEKHQFSDFLVEMHLNVGTTVVDTVKKSASSGMLVDPILDRITESISTYIRYGIQHTSKSFQDVQRTKHKIQSGFDFLSGISNPYGLPGVSRLNYTQQVRLYLAHKTTMAAERYMILVSSRNLIFEKEFKIYFGLLRDHFKKSRDLYMDCLDELKQFRIEDPKWILKDYSRDKSYYSTLAKIVNSDSEEDLEPLDFEDSESHQFLNYQPVSMTANDKHNRRAESVKPFVPSRNLSQSNNKQAGILPVVDVGKYSMDKNDWAKKLNFLISHLINDKKQKSSDAAPFNRC
ncbi:hypothetical protein RF11_06313 [Thelohanellus kitauei]|uniref:Uncharacterized protein n=1 Tax=Thelohanellus kitauei TaxID=669202 RepID=A0A0C2MLQ0_THEKT|nr:hypothetical protein RF11_06313 [Thelohanellus kitauei]